MKRTKFIFLGSLCIIAVGAFLYACADKALEMDYVEEAATRAVDEQPVNKYYRVLPGTSEWKSLETGDEMFQVSQLPESMLRELSTEELVDACMQFPLAYDYLFANNERYATAFAVQNFNGLTELSKRRDCITELLKVYREMPYSEYPIRDNLINPIFAFNLGYLELVLIDSTFLEKAQSDELELLYEIALIRYQEKLSHLNYMDISDIRRSFLVLSEVRLRNSPSLTSEERDILKDYTENYTSYENLDLEKLSVVLIK